MYKRRGITIKARAIKNTRWAKEPKKLFFAKECFVVFWGFIEHNIKNFFIMITRKISSLQHPIVKHLKKLRTCRNYRYAQQSIILIGKKIVQEAATLYAFKTLIIAEENTNFAAEKIYTASNELFQKISGLPSPEPWIAEIAMPSAKDLGSFQFLLALDGIQDPGNLGSLFRTAWAFGVEGIFLLNAAVDPYNDKVLRASKGAVLRIPFTFIAQQKFLRIVEQKKAELFIADLQGTDFSTASYQKPLIVLLGNESHGPSNHFFQLGQKITIPMKRSFDSINVATAGGILMQYISGFYD
jgi:TrmH family RNA methyltransferase